MLIYFKIESIKKTIQLKQIWMGYWSSFIKFILNLNSDSWILKQLSPTLFSLTVSTRLWRIPFLESLVHSSFTKRNHKNCKTIPESWKIRFLGGIGIDSSIHNAWIVHSLVSSPGNSPHSTSPLLELSWFPNFQLQFWLPTPAYGVMIPSQLQ